MPATRRLLIAALPLLLIAPALRAQPADPRVAERGLG